MPYSTARFLLSLLPIFVLLWILVTFWKGKKNLQNTRPIILGVSLLMIARLQDMFEMIRNYPSIFHKLNFLPMENSLFNSFASFGNISDTIAALILIQGFMQSLKVKVVEHEHIGALETILPICATCKKIRYDDDNWENIEEYLEHSGSPPITHGICPECKSKLLKEVETKKKRQLQ
ncbi:MAG: hypothetical protein ACHQQQ_14330 [Bacteroidota bacterium]